VYGSRAALIREKCGGERKETNDAMRWGTNYEPIARSIFEAYFGVEVKQYGLVKSLDVSLAQYAGSPDGVISNNGGSSPLLVDDHSRALLEIKCPTTLYDDIPVRYMPQIQGLMQLMDLNFCYFMSWTPEEFRVWGVGRSSSYWGWMRPLLDECWQHICEGGTQPKRLKKRPEFPGRVITRRVV